METKICIFCNKEFIPKRKSQKYCSDTCRYKAKYEKRCQREDIKHLNEPRICPLCGKEFTSHSPGQKYCDDCIPIAKRAKVHRFYERHREEIIPKSVKRVTEWRKRNPNKLAESRKRYRQKHHDELMQKKKVWRHSNPDKAREESRKHQCKRNRHLEYFPLNKYFEGSEAHHLNRFQVVYIPKELHRSISHNLWTGKNMDEINKLAWEWIKYEGET